MPEIHLMVTCMSGSPTHDPLPEKTAKDVAHLAVKSLLSVIPGAGGPLAEIFAYLIAEPVSKRRDAWMEQISSRLCDLQDRLNRPILEDLRKDDHFITMLINAGQIAVRNHQQEKLEALANAVLNSALDMTRHEIERSIMLNLIDQLTPTHVAFLRFFQSPSDNPEVTRLADRLGMGGLNHVISAAFPELGGRSELVDIIWHDLVVAGLLREGGMNVTMTGSGLVQKRTTDFGDRFLRFIASPAVDARSGCNGQAAK